MSNKPGDELLAGASTPTPTPENRVITIQVDVGKVMDALKGDHPAELQQALQQVLAFPVLADDDEIAALLDRRFATYRRGVPYPIEHLGVLLARTKPLGDTMLNLVQSFASHGDPAVAGLALEVLGKHGGTNPGIRDRIACEIVNGHPRVIVAAIRALALATVDIEQTLEDLLRAALHAWTYFRGDSQQDGIRGEVYAAFAKQLARLEVLPSDLYRRIHTELNISLGCPAPHVAAIAQEAFKALQAKRPAA